METRYNEIIIWSIEYVIFCLFIICLYRFVSKYTKNIVIKIGDNRLFSLPNGEIILIMVLTIVVGIRCNCGSDYYNYLIRYREITRWYTSITDVIRYRFQCGYDAIAYCIHKVTENDNAIFIVIGLLIYIPTILLIKKRSINPNISIAAWLLLGYFSMTTNIVKQSLAMVALLLAYDAIQNKCYIRFIIFALLSCMFHLSAIYIVIVMFLSAKIVLTKKLFFSLSFIGVLGFLGLKPFILFISRYLPVHYYMYVEQFLDANEMKIQLGAVMVTVFYLIFIWIFTTSSVYYDIKGSYYEPMLTIMFFCIPWLFMGMRYYIFNRIAYEGLQFIIFLFPMLMKNRSNKKYFYMVCILFSMMFSILCAENNYYHYGTIFGEQPMTVWEYSIRHRQDRR